MKCPKCRGKMLPMNGTIEVTVGETFLKTISDAFRCCPCDINMVQLQVRVQPIKPVVKGEGIEIKENPFAHLDHHIMLSKKNGKGEGHA